MKRKTGYLPCLLLGGLLFGLSGGLLWWQHSQTAAPESTNPYATLQPDRTDQTNTPPTPSPYSQLKNTTGPATSAKAPATIPTLPAKQAAQTPSVPKKSVSQPLPSLPIPATGGDEQFSGPNPRNADGWYVLGTQARQAGDHHKAARAFAQAAALNPSAANWRALADEQVILGDYAAATRAYDQAIRRYEAGGDRMTARALAHLAAPFRQTLDVQVIVPKTGAVPAHLARLEPPRGVLLGVHVSADGVVGAWGKPPQMAAQLKSFAVAFRYWKFSTSSDPDAAN